MSQPRHCVWLKGRHSIAPPRPSTAAPNALRAKVANQAKQSAQRGITGARKSSLAGPPLDSSPPPGRPHPTARNKVTHLISTPTRGVDQRRTLCTVHAAAKNATPSKVVSPRLTAGRFLRRRSLSSKNVAAVFCRLHA